MTYSLLFPLGTGLTFRRLKSSVTPNEVQREKDSLVYAECTVHLITLPVPDMDCIIFTGSKYSVSVKVHIALFVLE